MRWVLIGLVRVYRAIVSPLWHGLMGPQAGCRFSPSCSGYAQEALRVHGAWRGSVLSLRRVCRCHPYYKGRYIDPVPPQR